MQLNNKSRHSKSSFTWNRLFDFSTSTRSSIDHTRLRLGFPCVIENLFKINCQASAICECGLDSESVKQLFFLFCSRYATQRYVLLTSAARILGETWSSNSDARKLFFLLLGVQPVNCDVN